MTNIRRVLAVLFLFASSQTLTAFAGLAMGSAAAAEGPLAQAVISEKAISFLPQKEFGKATLRVRGPADAFFEWTFAAGAPIVLQLNGGENPFLDGAYNFELVAEPVLQAKNGTEREKAQRQLTSDSFTLSGTFSILGGSAVLPDRVEESKGTTSRKRDFGLPTRADQVIPDDLIVQGSSCIGLDCVNNESFGFDTIRLKENNTRIKFDDTSTGAGFPANDWQLTANDSASGGASKFSIEDITGSKVPFTLRAGAPTNSIFVDSSGRLGLRTSTPVLDLHLATSNTPAMRLEQNNSGGFTAQTWDIAGNEANFFVRDVTGGSKLPFRIRPGAPTSSIDINADGNVGIGTASPDNSLHVFKGSAGTVTSLNLTQATIENSGDAGLSLLNPDANIGRLVFGTPTDNSAGLVRWDFTNNLFEFGTDRTGADIRFLTGDFSEAMRILDNGNVGIGTTTPGGKLDVNGSIFQRGGVLFADYVFEPSYQIESIEEHSEFMWQNGHLKGVPSKRVDENGQELIEVGAQSRGILEELEKAHVYIEQLHARMKALEEKIAKLEKP